MEKKHYSITETEDLKIDNTKLGKQHINKLYDLSFEYNGKYLKTINIPENCTIKTLFDIISYLTLNSNKYFNEIDVEEYLKCRENRGD